MNVNEFRAAARVARSVLRNYLGAHPRECPLCGYSGKFRAFGSPPRWDAQCPGCWSLERHRLLALFLDCDRGLVRGEVVHFAPEAAMAKLLRPLAGRYRSADLFNTADLNLNIEAMDLPDASVDLFVCSHVLEHVDDRKALAELYRCLGPGGSAIIMVPIVEAWPETYEDPGAASPRDRELHFGQSDHVRYYGADLRDRIKEAGFQVSEFTASGAECVRYGLMRGETVFLATK